MPATINKTLNKTPTVGRRVVAVLCSMLAAAAAAAPPVVASIAPLHSLLQGVMGDTGQAQLLLPPELSPHDAQLTPSQVQLMQKAALIFYVHDSFEQFLPAAFAALPQAVRRVSVTQNMTLLPRRPLIAGDGQHGTDDDLHVWLDVERAQKIVRIMERELTAAYPHHGARYAANARRLQARLENLAVQLDAMLAGVRGRPFVVWHDAYHYFEHRHRLIGGITVQDRHAQPLSAKRLRTVRRLIADRKPVCLFTEPQMSARPVTAVSEGVSINIGVLDPLGEQSTPGESMYFDLLLRLAETFATVCGKTGTRGKL